MQEIATVSKGAASLHGRVPSHLLHPLLIWVNGDPGDVYLAALKMDEKQRVVCHQSAQRKDLHCEKVGPRQHRQVSPNECCPGGCLLARRCLSLIHISEPTRLLSIAYAVFFLKKQNV